MTKPLLQPWAQTSFPCLPGGPPSFPTGKQRGMAQSITTTV